MRCIAKFIKLDARGIRLFIATALNISKVVF